MNYDDGFVWKNDKTTFKFNYSNKTPTFIEIKEDSTTIIQGMSFIQTAYNYFVNL